MRAFLVIPLLSLACATKQSKPDGEARDGCSFSAYTAPGCGQSAVLESVTCGPDSGCLMEVCTCDGQTRQVACGVSPVSFASFGACDGGVGDAAADASVDACAQSSGACWSDYPRCTFVTSPAAGAAQCVLADCTVVVDAGADAGPYGCGTCPDGYSCAVLCPSPLGGCGPPALCCAAH